jgi:hypothetical protein
MLFITWYQSQKLEFLYSRDFFPCTSLRRPIDSCLLHQEASSIAGSLFLMLLFSRRLTASRHHQQESAAPVRLLLLFQVVEATRGASLLLGVYALLPHHRCDPIRRREPLPGPAAAGSPLLCFLALV